MNKYFSSLCAGLALITVVMTTLRANDMTHHDLAKKVRDADLIVLGQAVSDRATANCGVPESKVDSYTGGAHGTSSPMMAS